MKDQLSKLEEAHRLMYEVSSFMQNNKFITGRLSRAYGSLADSLICTRGSINYISEHIEATEKGE